MPSKIQHPLYCVWHSMKERCRNPNFKHWQRYGGRGISVCDRWKGPQGFDNFLEDMGPRPKGFSLDRINNDGNYEPANCRWASRREQQRNQSVTRKIVVNGIQYTAVELAELAGLKTDTIVKRAAHNLSFAELIEKHRRVFTPGLQLGGLANGARQKAKTHCPRGHEYNASNTYITAEGFRRCRACRRKPKNEKAPE